MILGVDRCTVHPEERQGRTPVAAPRPWECSMKEIHQDVSKGLEIIPASLLRT